MTNFRYLNIGYFLEISEACDFVIRAIRAIRNLFCCLSSSFQDIVITKPPKKE